MARRAIASLADVPHNGGKAFDVDGKSVLVCRSTSGVFVMENMCSHAFAYLEGGKVKGPHIFCPLHGVRFDMRNGSPSGTLTRKSIAIYAATVEDDIVYADVPPA